MKYFIHRSIRVLLLLICTTLANGSQAASLLSVAGASVPNPKHRIGGKELWGVAMNTVANPDVLCLDGTNPIFYVDEAVNGPSDKWVFFLQGGGSCSTGQECADKYILSNDRYEMSTNWATQSISGKGILNPDPLINHFADYNRVKIKKCSFDRWMGNKTVSSGNVMSPAGVLLNYEMHFYGRKIVKAVFNQLAMGISYHEDSCDGDENCGSLPALQDASIILLTGSSGGGIGLSHAADDLASEIRTMQEACANPPCAEADIRAVVDAAFMPGLDNEYHFSALNIGGTMNFSSAATGLPGTAIFDLQTFSAPSGRLYAMQETWRDDRDSSCEALHGPNHPLCEDHMHLLRYHLETPVFIFQDLEDPNSIHVDKGNGWTPPWALSSDFPVSVSDYKSRVIHQANSFENLQIGGLPVRIFTLACQHHVNLTHNDGFFSFQLENVSSGMQRSFHDTLNDWVNNPGNSTLIEVDDTTNYMTVLGSC